MKRIKKTIIFALLLAMIMNIVCISSINTVSASNLSSVYVDVKAASTGEENYWAWIWTDESDGHWQAMDIYDDGVYVVNMKIGENAVFARIRSGEQADWNIVWNQSEDTQYSGEFNCVSLSFSDSIGGKLKVEWKNISALDKNELSDMIRQAGHYLFEIPEQYTESSLAVLENAYYNGQTIYESADTQEQVDNATAQIKNAISQLVPQGQQIVVDKSRLFEAIGIAVSYSTSLTHFKPETWDKMQEKLDAAHKVYYDEKATQADVDKATNELNLAIDGLVPVEIDKGELKLLLEHSNIYINNKELYTEESYNTFNLALNDAQIQYDRGDNQYEIDNAILILNTAISGLMVKSNIIGDVDGDGITSIKDVTYIQKSIVLLIKLDEKQFLLADVNKDGIVSINDASLLQKHIVGIEDLSALQ